jgi:hypothetical protein
VSNPTTAAAIRSRFNTQWAGATTIAWDNVAFTPPTGTPWVRVSIRPSDAYQASIGTTGARTFRDEGLIFIGVFVPENEGEGEAWTLAESAADIFRGVTAAGVVYSGPAGDAPRVEVLGPDGSGWFQVQVRVYYRADQTA